MADEEEGSEDTSGGGGGGDAMAEAVKCEECPPGLPGWMATFSDLVTLLLTFFVLLLSFAKTETAKYEAALGSIRNAFGGNVLKQGDVVVRGKSPDGSMSMIESAIPPRPFPIEFLSTEGLLDKHEVNRTSEEDELDMKRDLKDYQLSDSVTMYTEMEGIRVDIKDKIYFKKGSIKLEDVNVEVFQKMVNMLKGGEWTVFVVGHASRGETSTDKTKDAYQLSSLRSGAVARALIRRGVLPKKVTMVFYGDTRPDEAYANAQESPEQKNRRVEFILRRKDLKPKSSHKIDAI